MHARPVAQRFSTFLSFPHVAECHSGSMRLRDFRPSCREACAWRQGMGFNVHAPYLKPRGLDHARNEGEYSLLRLAPRAREFPTPLSVPEAVFVSGSTSSVAVGVAYREERESTSKKHGRMRVCRRYSL